MLLEYGVSNFCSFEKYSYIDLHPAKNRILSRFPNNFVTLPTGEKVLKTAVIVGENAGGKSNFIKSLAYLTYLITRTDRTPRSAPNFINSKNLVKKNSSDKDRSEDIYDPEKSMSDQNFNLCIAFDHITYFYDLDISADGVVFEELSYRLKRGSKKRLVFSCEVEKRSDCASCERNSDCIEKSNKPQNCRRWGIRYNANASDFDLKLIEALNGTVEDFTHLTLVRLATLGEPKCREVLDWFRSELIVVTGLKSSFIDSSEESGELFEILKSDKYLNILRLADRSIFRFEIDSKKPFENSFLVRRDDQGREFREEVKEDSTGIRRFVYWAFYIYQIVYKNKTVFADEIDSAINPTLSDKVIAYINGTDHEGQLIFATHNIFNLSLRTFMKEQINFVTKDSDTLDSELYSLADFDEIRYDIKEELYEFYMKGILGGTVHA